MIDVWSKSVLDTRPWLHPRRDDQRRYPHAVASERLGVVVGRFGRRDVIEEAAVLVVEDDQERLFPLRAGCERVVDGEHELLAVPDVRGRVVVVGLKADRVEVAEVRVDPGDRRQRTMGGVFEKARRFCVDPELEPGPPVQVGLAEEREPVVVAQLVVPRRRSAGSPPRTSTSARRCRGRRGGARTRAGCTSAAGGAAGHRDCRRHDRKSRTDGWARSPREQS